MYFIYFTVFVLMVFVPAIVNNNTNFSGINDEVLETLLILLLGTIGFAIYLWQEKRFKINFRKRIEVQKESHQIFRDLGEAYSYIGEVNRKLEIMKGLAREISDNCSKENALAYAPFFEAFTLLGKSNKVIIQFIDSRSRQLLKEVKSSKKIKLDLEMNNKELLEKEEKFFETEKYFITKSPADIDGIVAFVIIRRDLSNHRIEDPDMMKALASQILQFFILSEREKGRLSACLLKK